MVHQPDIAAWQSSQSALAVWRWKWRGGVNSAVKKRPRVNVKSFVIFEPTVKMQNSVRAPSH